MDKVIEKNFRLIDAHIHLEPQWAELALRVMDRCEVELSVSLGWMDAYGERLGELLAAFEKFPGRFVQLCNIDWRGVDSSDFGLRAADDLEAAVEAGAGGLKIFKDLGLGVRLAEGKGELLRVDDRRLDPLFERAGALAVPVLIHTADPVWFWRPPAEGNFWSAVLEGRNAEWSYYRKGFPGRTELLAERDNIVSRHPDTVFVTAHLASLADDPITFRETLEAHPNLYADISARLPAMSRSEKRRKLWREILNGFPDRILLGTDLIYIDQDVATGIQSQSFRKPEDLDFDISALSPEEAYEKTSAGYLDSHVKFLAEAGIQERAPFCRERGSFALTGLGLDREVLEKIFFKTPEKVYKIP